MSGELSGEPRRAQEEIGRAFDDLESLRLLLEETLGYASASLGQYRDDKAGGSGGWFHLLPSVSAKTPGDFSAASTATCLSFVSAADLAEIKVGQAQGLLDGIVSSAWESAGLDPDNPFTTAFLLEAIHDLLTLGAAATESQNKLIDEKLANLKSRFEHPDKPESDGGIAISPYPATAFLTFKAVKTLRSWQAHRPDSFDEELAGRVRRWAWACLHAESVLVSSGAQDADVFELAYAVLTISNATKLQDMTPPQRDVLAFAVDQFFATQSREGTWPRSRPLFLYPAYGDAYCFDYELLVALLADRQLRPMLRRKLTELRIATAALERRRFPLDKGFGWSSGHLRQVQSAESWSTASVFHFCYELQRLVADELRETVFDYLGERVGPIGISDGPHLDRTSFLDSPIELEDETEGPISLTDVLEDLFLSPLVANLSHVEHGQAFPREAFTSAILYGPPGTSKTKLAGLVARSLGWPLLTIDPSHLTRQGLDLLHAEAYRLFGMLQATERAVVLLDEFDELVREREGPNEVLSRFLTTAMLPKLTALSERRSLVVLLATNHLESFDTAISRPGRFDMVLPVMPPTLDAKLAHERWLLVAARAKRLKIDFGLAQYGGLASQLGDLTYAEYAAIADKLTSAGSARAFSSIAEEAHKSCTLMLVGEDKKTWKERIREQRSKIRPRLNS